MDAELKQKTLELLREQGPDGLIRNSCYRVTCEDGKERFCAGGAIAIAAGIPAGETYTKFICDTTGITFAQLMKVIHINDEFGYDAVMTYIEEKL